MIIRPVQNTETSTLENLMKYTNYWDDILSLKEMQCFPFPLEAHGQGTIPLGDIPRINSPIECYWITGPCQ